MVHNNFDKLPSVEQIADEIKALRAQLAKIGVRTADNDNEADHVELRLQVYPSGEWVLRWGSHQYDTDHRGWWGSGSLPSPEASDEQIYDTAADLLEQVSDMVAIDDGYTSAGYGI